MTLAVKNSNKLQLCQVFHQFFPISIIFSMQMDLNLPKFFCQTSYSLYSQNFLPPKFFTTYMVGNIKE